MAEEHLFKWNTYGGAGKGDSPRPLDKRKYKQNFSQIKGMGKMAGKLKKSRAGRTTWTY
jgi:hypothetical protein